MGDPEVMKAVVQGTVEGLISPVAEMFRQITGGAAEEVGEALKNYVRSVTSRRLPRLMAISKEMFERANIVPRPVPPKLLMPILENGSVEEDDELQDRWAALLVNCSQANDDFMPAAPEILKQLNAYEVLLLQMCYEFVSINAHGHPALAKKPLNEVYQKWFTVLVEKYGFMRFSGSLGHAYRQAAMMDNLKRLGLLELKPAGDGESNIHLTMLGFRFIELCQILS
jgi:hypothetical protein